jgi:hypothetical protein
MLLRLPESHHASDSDRDDQDDIFNFAAAAIEVTVHSASVTLIMIT